MSADPSPAFLAGVIEGFYGRPWTPTERDSLFDLMARSGLDTYFYAPKDDLHQRALWRDPYPEADLVAIAQAIDGCRARGLRFIYGISPGLDIRYADGGELDRVRDRFERMLGLGASDVALLFDDIPDQMRGEDLARFGSLAAAQCDVANETFAWLRDRHRGARLVLCPTPYCGRMAAAGLGGPGYLEALGRELHADIDVVWTGPDIVSREIPVEHVREIRRVLRRKPLIWDNLHANDYDGRRCFCGPYAGRPPALRDETAGLLSNPNNERALNFVPLRTLGAFARGQGEWDARAAYLSAMREWLPAFETIGRPVTLDDLILLGDCFYLPHEDGPEALALFERAHGLVSRDPSEWGGDADAFVARAARLRDVCAMMAELRDRPLFHALSRRIWDLREELDLLVRFVTSKQGAGREHAVRSDYHLPGTFRGGFVAKLQRLLVQHANGTFTASPDPDGAGAMVSR